MCIRNYSLNKLVHLTLSSWKKNETESVGKNEGLKHVINYKIVLEVENVRV